MVKLVLDLSGITYIGKVDTPFGPEETRIFKSWSDWKKEKQPIELTISDINLDVLKDCMLKVILEVTDFNLSTIPTPKELENVDKQENARASSTRKIFTIRAKEQIRYKRGQSYDILTTIRKTPGLTREEICIRLNLSIKSGSVSQNLVVLEDLNLIRSSKGRGIAQYYPV